ncbi:MAG: hypothetical protein EZS28_009104 [Streblomastix strix]|uniref:Uncharacterized protein n=1 Tax=Streblomastix strix TaxID=222440 RepID=A0A5J4WLD5_9EUKA|nr:MAG: hypothetical protein EZS28_009104 [Streblomastix strix]
MNVQDIENEIRQLQIQVIEQQDLQQKQILIRQGIVHRLSAMFVRSVKESLFAQIEYASQFGVGELSFDMVQQLKLNSGIRKLYALRVPICEVLTWFVQDDPTASGELIRGGDFLPAFQFMLVSLTVQEMNNAYLMPIAEVLNNCTKEEAQVIYIEGIIKSISRYLLSWEVLMQQQKNIHKKKSDQCATMGNNEYKALHQQEEQCIRSILSIIERVLWFKRQELIVGQQHPYTLNFQQDGTIMKLKDIYSRASNEMKMGLKGITDQDIEKYSAIIFGYICKAQSLKNQGLNGKDIVKSLQKCFASKDTLYFCSCALCALADIAEHPSNHDWITNIYMITDVWICVKEDVQLGIISEQALNSAGQVQIKAKRLLG